MHLEHLEENKSAVLICDKNPFIELHQNISEWLKGAQLKHLVTNDIYGNYEINLPEKFNGIFLKKMELNKKFRYKNFLNLSCYN